MSSKLERRFKKKGKQLPVILQKRKPAGTVKKFTHKKGWKRKTYNNNIIQIPNEMPRFKQTAVIPRAVVPVPRAAAQRAIAARPRIVMRPPAVLHRPPRVLPRIVHRAVGARRRGRVSKKRVKYTRNGIKYMRIGLNKPMREARGLRLKGKNPLRSYYRCAQQGYVFIPPFCRLNGGGRPRRRA